MRLSETPPGPAELRTLFARVPQSVTAVCGLPAGSPPLGMTASSLTLVSLQRPLISVSIANDSATWKRLRALERIGVSVLAHDQGTVCRALAAPVTDRFTEVAWQATDSGAVLVRDAVLWMECSIQAELPAGDHHIVLLHIRGTRHGTSDKPLIFHDHGFRGLSEAS